MNRKGFLGSLLALVVAPKNIAIDLAKPKIVSPAVEHLAAGKYIVGYMKMSKQLMKNLPYLQSTLPKMMLRDFGNKESDEFIKQLNDDRNI